MPLKTSIQQLLQGKALDDATCREAIEGILGMHAPAEQIAAFLMLLRAKGETADELVAMAKVLKQKMIPVTTDRKVLDIVGTGGDGLGTINISTASALLTAACGVPVAKHGSRAATSLSGSSDVLSALGVKIDLSAEQVSQSIAEVGIGFCFAPSFHPTWANIKTLRKNLGVANVFNLLGPLLNPASPAHFLMGVFDETYTCLMAEALQRLGTTHSIIAHSHQLDEISCLGASTFLAVTPEKIEKTYLDPHDLGLDYCELADLQGGDPETNARILRQLFTGQAGGLADTVMLNAAVALYLYGSFASVKAALPMVQDVFYRGEALKLLARWVEFSWDVK